MSSRRSRGSQSSSRITDDQINRLLTQLQQCLPEIRTAAARSDKVPASKVLEETCKYVKKLNKDVDNLSDRLAMLLSTMDPQTEEASIIRNLMTQF